MTEAATPHQWRFFRAGGFDQVLLESGEDLKQLASLDQKLWVALSCPVKGVQFNRKTLEFVDTDRDGQVRVPEILAAIQWSADRLQSFDILVEAPSALPLTAIDQSTEEGQRTLTSAREILKNLGKPDADAISIDDVIDIEKIFAGTGFNGDGGITTLSTSVEWLQEWITRGMATVEAATDRSGEPGITADQVAGFDAAAKAWQEWRNSSKALLAGSTLPALETACRLWQTLAPKIQDYFIRCRLAAFDERATVAMNSPEADLLVLGAKDLAAASDEVAALPLSLVTPAAVLDLTAGINPSWQADFSRFEQLVVGPLLSTGNRVTAPQWEELKTLMAPLSEWWSSYQESAVSAFGADLLTEWHEKEVAGKLTGLIDRDLELSGAAEAISEAETLVHYVRYLYPLLNNFVAFRDFYTKKGIGIFQCGTLYLDGRSCELCVTVTDPARHATLATLSRLYLVYCDCIRRGGTEKMTIAAAITNGDSDQIIVGRNGLFYDQDGNDWDATIVRIIDHPISLRQAFWSPYKKVGRMVGEQLQKLASARSKTAEDKTFAGTMKVIETKPDAKPAAPSAPPPAPQPMFDVGKYVGIFAAIGLALGALGSAVATTIASFMKLQWWQMPLAIAGVMLLVSGPAMLLAWLKLRQRNLGPLLDANGWAINARAKLNIPFGASLTSLPKLPEGSRQLLADPFAEKKRPWKSILLILILLAVGIFIWIRN
ncbi:MAG: hypothetical protein FIA91_01640 [Geobacter sp.]|nr:hypothetical protein [Geobacter sp.]